MAKKRQKKETIEKSEEDARPVIEAVFLKERAVTENSNEARELYNQSRYGSLTGDGKVQLSLLESMYLLEKKRISLYDGRNKEMSSDSFLKKALDRAALSCFVFLRELTSLNCVLLACLKGPSVKIQCVSSKDLSDSRI